MGREVRQVLALLCTVKVAPSNKSDSSPAEMVLVLGCSANRSSRRRRPPSNRRLTR